MFCKFYPYGCPCMLSPHCFALITQYSVGRTIGIPAQDSFGPPCTNKLHHITHIQKISAVRWQDPDPPRELLRESSREPPTGTKDTEDMIWPAWQNLRTATWTKSFVTAPNINDQNDDEGARTLQRRSKDGTSDIWDSSPWQRQSYTDLTHQSAEGVEIATQQTWILAADSWSGRGSGGWTSRAKDNWANTASKSPIKLSCTSFWISTLHCFVRGLCGQTWYNIRFTFLTRHLPDSGHLLLRGWWHPWRQRLRQCCRWELLNPPSVSGVAQLL